MNINKYKFKKYLVNKNYSTCIYMLDNEIKNIFINKINAIDNNFEYVNLLNLRNKCIEYLNNKDSISAIEFYNLSINQEDELSELNSLLNIYKNIT